VDTGDELDKRILMTRIKNYDNPFKSNFWRVNLLNNHASMKESYFDICEKFKIL